MVKCLMMALIALSLTAGYVSDADAWDLSWCLKHHVTTGACAKWFPPVTNSNNNANSNTNSNSNTNTNTQGQQQQQGQKQGQTQTATGGAGGSSASSSGVINSGENGDSSASNTSNYQAPIYFIAPANACDRAAIGATVTTRQAGIGVTVPLGRRGADCDHSESRLDRCVRYATMHIAVNPATLDCHDVAIIEPDTPVAALPITPPPVAVPGPTQVIYKTTDACIPDSSKAADLAYIHANRWQLRTNSQSAAMIAAGERLRKACVPTGDVLHALDGRSDGGT